MTVEPIDILLKVKKYALKRCFSINQEFPFRAIPMETLMKMNPSFWARNKTAAFISKDR